MNPIFFRLAEIATDLDNEFPEEAEQLDQALDALGDDKEQTKSPAPPKASAAPLPPQEMTPPNTDQVPPAGMDQPEPAAESQPQTFFADESAEKTEASPADAKAEEEAQIEESTEATAAPLEEADASYTPSDVESAIDGLADLVAKQLDAEGWDLGMPATIQEFQRRIKEQLEDASMY